MSAHLDLPVPFLDVGATYSSLKAEIDAAITEGLESGWYVLGEGVARFEEAFAAWVGAAHCVGLGNGLDALHLSLRALGIGPGDEVLVPAQTFIATWLAVSQTGATPVPVDVDPRSGALDPALLAASVTPRTQAILPVHLFGHPADMDAVAAVAERYGLVVLGDAAQAHGACWNDKPVGALGPACWSFYPGKNLGALGDGGAVTTDDPLLAERLRCLRNYGSAEKYVHTEAGINSRLDDLQARILSAKLPHLAAWNDRRMVLARHYREGLEDLDGPDGLRLLAVDPRARPAWHLFPVFTPRRDALRDQLTAAGIQTQIHYPIPPHRQQAYAALGYGEGAFPQAERMAAETLSLPIGPHLRDDQVDRVIRAVRAFFDH